MLECVSAIGVASRVGGPAANENSNMQWVSDSLAKS